MNDENIFKLLLIVLLMGNNYGKNGECAGSSLFGNVNDVIIMALLTGIIGDGANTALPLTETTF